MNKHTLDSYRYKLDTLRGKKEYSQDEMLTVLAITYTLILELKKPWWKRIWP